jgi:ribose transport system substrate-binding protein
MSTTRVGEAGRRFLMRSETAATRGGRRTLRRIAVAGVLSAAVASSLAACGSSSSSSSASSASTASGASTTTSASAGADVAAANAGLAAFTGHPSPFPVTEPFKHAVPAATKFVYLQAADPIGALIGQLLKPGVTAMGAKYIAINAGSTASSAQAAASSALALKPAVVLIPAFLPSEFGGRLQALKAAGVKIVGSGMIGWKPYGIDFCVNCEEFSAQNGKLLADWAVSLKGDKTNAVFYSVPELSFTATMWTAFQAQMKQLCPKCQVRNVPIGVATIGSTAPQTMVTDLQSHPDTNVAAFSTMDMAQGLPPAMKSAGVNVATVGSVPTPQNLQDIKAGNLTGGIAMDLATYVWEMVDVGGRLAIGQTPQASEKLGPSEVLTQKDITFDPSKGYVGYPDFAQRYAKLWHP